MVVRSRNMDWWSATSCPGGGGLMLVSFDNMPLIVCLPSVPWVTLAYSLATCGSFYTNSVLNELLLPLHFVIEAARLTSVFH